MAYTDKQWETVRAFYERGLTLSEITLRKEVAIFDRGSISKKAKKEGWVHGSKATLISNEINVIAEKATQNATERLIHETIVDERTKHLEFFNKAGLILAQAAVKRVQADHDMPMQDMRHASEVIAKQRDGVLGKSPVVAVQVNNTVAPAPMTRAEVEAELTRRGLPTSVLRE